MDYKLEADTEVEPSLVEMTAKALEVLKKNENGFVLLVEGGRIDHGHHETRSRISLEETLEFEKAVELVKKETSEEDTLIVVTADHGHVFTVGGYPVRRLMKFRS
jgi:alkaline phosphatase